MRNKLNNKYLVNVENSKNYKGDNITEQPAGMPFTQNAKSNITFIIFEFS